MLEVFRTGWFPNYGMDVNAVANNIGHWTIPLEALHNTDLPELVRP